MTSRSKNIEIRNIAEAFIGRYRQTPITDRHLRAHQAKNCWAVSSRHSATKRYTQVDRRVSCPHDPHSRQTEKYGHESRGTRNQE
jgi:hypothetical protein